MAEFEDEVEDVNIRKRPQRKFKKHPLAFRSPYWTSNISKLKNVSAREKLISDYAFLPPNEEYPSFEMLFSGHDLFATRVDFATLASSYQYSAELGTQNDHDRYEKSRRSSKEDLLLRGCLHVA